MNQFISYRNKLTTTNSARSPLLLSAGHLPSAYSANIKDCRVWICTKTPTMPTKKVNKLRIFFLLIGLNI